MKDLIWEALEYAVAIILIIAVLLLGVWVNGNTTIRALAEEREAEATDEVWTELGTYKITHYCAGKCCSCGTGITASGTKCTRYRTVAMKNVPFGTTVYIEGYGYRVVEDRGGGLSDKQVDVYTPEHSHAKELGVKYRKVWIVNRK